MTLSLSKLLIDSDVITNDQWLKLSSSKNIFQEIINVSAITEADVLRLLSLHLSIPFKKVPTQLIDLNIINCLPESLARQHSILPLFQMGEKLVVATNNPFNTEILEELEVITTSYITPIFITQENLLQLFSYTYSTNSVKSTDINPAPLIDMGLQTYNSPSEAKENESKNDQISSLVNDILLQAVNQNVSDIHFEPTQSNIVIKFRIDGLLKEVLNPAKQLGPQLVAYIKSLANLDVTQTTKPQDGRLTFLSNLKEIHFRASTIRTIYGEKIVLSVLDKSSTKFSLDTFHLLRKDYTTINSLLDNSSGMILVCGSASRAKTDLLYSFLTKLNTPEKNIITIENPIKTNLEGINQIPINSSLKLDYSTSLSAAINQDPDVIMINDIQDVQTATIAINSALNNQLVLSSLHTKTAIGTITRLLRMGVQPFLINSAILGIIEHHYINQICPRCKTEASYEDYVTDKSKSLISKLEKHYKSPKLFKGAGCDFCNHTGYKGTVSLFHILTLDDDIKQLIASKESQATITTLTSKNNISPIEADGIEKIISGMTTVDEVAQFC